MKGIFSYDGPIITFLTKVGEILILNIITIICCLPIVTIGASLTSLYYAMVKCVVHDRSSLLREYFKSFRRVFAKSVLVTLLLIIWFAVLLYLRYVSVVTPSQHHLVIAYDCLIVVSAAVSLYIFPVMSRFENKLINLIKLSFVMSIRYFYLTILFAVVIVATLFLVIYAIPVMWGLILPGFMCYALSFLMEKPLLKYMPPVPEGTDDWFHEKVGKKDDAKKSEDLYKN